MGRRVKVCQPCKQVYLPPNSGIDQSGDEVSEGERTMSRAAKGVMKYGKDGMKALAKAGRDGASDEKLDKIRDKHDHYNEGVAEGLNFDEKKGRWEWDDGTRILPDELTPAQKQRVQQWKAANPGKRQGRATPDTRGEHTPHGSGAGPRVFEQGVAETEAPLKHHTARVSYHKEGDPHRRYEAIFKTTHNGGKEETEKRAKAAFAAKKKIVYNIVHEQGVAEDDAGDVEQRFAAKMEKEKQRLAKLKQTDPEAYKREIAKRKTSSNIPPVSTFEQQGVAEGYVPGNPFNVADFKRHMDTVGKVMGRAPTNKYQVGQIVKYEMDPPQEGGSGVGKITRVNKVGDHYEIDGSKIVNHYEIKGVKPAEQGVAEEWSKKYKSSINCSHPKGFSQKAHCAGKKKHNEDMTMESVCPDCGMCQTHSNVMEIKKGAKDSNGFTKCWPGHHAAGTKKGKNGGQVRNCVPNEGVAEDHEIQMATSELESIAKNAVRLLDLVRKYSEQQGLDAWQQSKITKAADYLNAVLQAVSGEQTALEGRNDGYQHGFASPDAPRLGSRPNQGDDERHDLDDFELQRNRQEVTYYNITIDGKPINPKPIFGRSATIAWGKEQDAAGVDLSNAMISPVRNTTSEDHSDMGKGWGQGSQASAYASSALAGAGHDDRAMEDKYMAELYNKLAEKIPKNAPVDVWIKDFEKSNAPQFKGKNLAKRRQMAIAASYGAKNPSKKK